MWSALVQSYQGGPGLSACEDDGAVGFCQCRCCCALSRHSSCPTAISTCLCSATIYHLIEHSPVTRVAPPPSRCRLWDLPGQGMGRDRGGDGDCVGLTAAVLGNCTGSYSDRYARFWSSVAAELAKVYTSAAVAMIARLLTKLDSLL